VADASPQQRTSSVCVPLAVHNEGSASIAMSSLVPSGENTTLSGRMPLVRLMKKSGAAAVLMVARSNTTIWPGLLSASARLPVSSATTTTSSLYATLCGVPTDETS